MFDAEALSIDDVASDRPTVNFKVKGKPVALRCDYVAGCDGFWVISRQAIPTDAVTVYEKEHPFAWLGILARCHRRVTS